MYTHFFGLQEKPFSIVPNPGVLYPSAKHRLAILYLEYGITAGNGFILLTGDVGTGKTTLIRHLMDNVAREMEVAVIFNTNVTNQELLRLILHEFEIEPGERDKADMLNRFNAFLIDQYAQGRKVLLVIDEAQNLTDEGLEEVRMLSNLQSSSSPLLQIMLVGQPELRMRLAQPDMSQLAQRIGVRFHLGPLSRQETREYVLYRLSQAGGDNEDLFTDEAIEAVHRHARGIPRSINLLCDAAMVYAFADEAEQITGEIVEQVIADRDDSVASRLEMVAAEGPDLQQVVPDSGQTPPEVWSRIMALESRMEQVAGKLDWFSRELTEHFEHNREQLVVKLEEMLVFERNRSEKLLQRLGKYRDEIRRLHRLVPLDTGMAHEPEQPAKPKKGKGIGGLFWKKK